MKPCEYCQQPILGKGKRYCSQRCAHMWLNRRDSVQPTMSPTIADLAWAGGFLEGEGFFGSMSSGSGQRVVARQNQEWPIRKLQAFFGGHCSLVPQRKNKLSRRPIWTWEVSGARARGIMMTLFSFLSPWRRAQVKAAMQCHATTGKG